MRDPLCPRRLPDEDEKFSCKVDSNSIGLKAWFVKKA